MPEGVREEVLEAADVASESPLMKRSLHLQPAAQETLEEQHTDFGGIRG